ncbi:hypothetical protein CLOP_g24650 [Closterium sp. NIES-67]|nr:hypothetical protein CLOP_g24650 [Closterium sp. NIES-67]
MRFFSFVSAGGTPALIAEYAWDSLLEHVGRDMSITGGTPRVISCASNMLSGRVTEISLDMGNCRWRPYGKWAWQHLGVTHVLGFSVASFHR